MLYRKLQQINRWDIVAHKWNRTKTVLVLFLSLCMYMCGVLPPTYFFSLHSLSLYFLYLFSNKRIVLFSSHQQVDKDKVNIFPNNCLHFSLHISSDLLLFRFSKEPCFLGFQPWITLLSLLYILTLKKMLTEIRKGS
jgi:hypothetical protein